MAELTGVSLASRWMRYNSSANGRVTSAACCALRIFDAATICIALVICAVLLIDLMRRRKSRGLSMSHRECSFPGLLELLRGRLQLGLQCVAECLFLPILASNSPFRVVKYSVNLFWNSLTRATGTSST